MAAKKAEIQNWSHEDIDLDPQRIGLNGSPTQVMKIFTPPKPSGGKIFEGEVQAAVADLLTELRAAGIPVGQKKDEG
jgi:electron transfer flavoprotein beta subunit